MNAHNPLLSQEKARLRRRFASLRESKLPTEVAAASRELCQRLSEWPLLSKASTALAYLAFRNELDLAGAHCLLPDVLWTVPRIEGKRLTIHPYDSDRLVRHRFGMLEPDPHLPVVAPEQIDVVLVPGLAFGEDGSRLGFGGGFYDRFLPTVGAVRVGIAYEGCVVESLPHGKHDQRIDWIATPTRIIACVPPVPAQASVP